MNTKNTFRWFALWVLIGLVALLMAPTGAVQASTPAVQAAAPATTFNCATVSEISQPECQALVALYASTQGDSWTNHAGWLENATPCAWFGVTCVAGHVLTLYLPYNNLSGPLPSQIGGLAWLSSLILRSNAITGPLPPEIGGLESLEVLYLSDNQVSGAIPTQIANLVHLKYFVMANNQLSGPIQPQFGYLMALQTAVLSGNQLSGPLPSILGNLAHLQYLDVMNNQLSGDLPACLGSMTALTSLLLSGNHFNIPAEPLLSQINAKTASDPNWAANQTPLPPVPPTPFSCTSVTEIPLGECQALSAFYNSTGGPSWTDHTGWLETTTPCSWYGVTCTSGHVYRLNLNNNHLSGPLPPEIAGLTSLDGLYLSNNQLSGPIPPEVGNLKQLMVFYMGGNQLSGPIPPEMGDMTNLTYLIVWQNNLSGALPVELGKLTKLGAFDVHSNQLSGAIPAEIGALPGLSAANFTTNQFCGSIPSTLGTSATLKDLKLSGNHLYIPPEPLLTQLKARTPNDPNWTANQTAGVCGTGKTLLALYVLAFDNGAQSTNNLSGYFSATMQSIASATSARPGVRAVVLADLSGPDNVAVYEVSNGVATQVTEGLPPLTESTVVDGPQLGGFLQWARTTYPADSVSMYYVGHNKPIPQEGINAGSSTLVANSMTDVTLFPLPIHDGAHPDYTDATPTNEVLSVYDLGEALRIASADGAQPLDLLDLSSCFSMSFEETYPLRHSAQTIVGSANYAFFEPALAGDFLTAQQPGMAPRDLAAAVLNAEDAALPATGHPRLLVAIDTSKMDAMKDAWDAVSYKLYLGLNNPTTRQSFRNALVAAYQASSKFDCTFCQPQDWALETPDALVDLHSFAAQLRNQFGATSDVGIAANDAFGILYQLLIGRDAHNGVPWFGNPAKSWNFEGALGLSLYADFVGRADSQGHILLNDIAPWYTREVTSYNPHPYEFVQNGDYGQEIQPEGITWADVFISFWSDNTNLLTELCLPDFPQVAEQGDLIAGAVTSPTIGSTVLGKPVTLSGTVKSINDAHNVEVNFYIVQHGVTILTAPAIASFIAAGATVTVTSDVTWTPTQTGPFTVYMVVDPNAHFQEITRSNNYTYLNDTVNGYPAYPRPEIEVALSGGQQWWNASPVRLVVFQNPETITTDASKVNKLALEFYQFQPGQNPNTQLPVKVASLSLSPVSLPSTALAVDLPTTVHAGIVVLHIWPYSDGGGMGSGREVTFNYVPAGATLGSQQAQYFSFQAAAGDHIEINMAVSQGSTRMYVWMPGNSWSAQGITDSGTITVDPALAGTYLVCVLGKADGTVYTLSATKNGAGPLAIQSGSVVTTEIRQRPDFSQPPLSTPALYNGYMPMITR